MNPFGSMAIVLGLLLMLLIATKALAAGKLGAEASRKVVHIGMGVVCLAFPRLFVVWWQVWSLAALAGAALGAVRFLPALRREFGEVLHGVGRTSWGEIYFPLGVATAFTLARGQPLLFYVPVAILTFADAAGALIGRRWGRRRFDPREGSKTVEGSLAVGVFSFLCTAIPLLMGGRSVQSAVLLGALMAISSLLVEAVSRRGLDNLTLPLAACTQMGIYLDAPGPVLVAGLLAWVGILAGAIFWQRRPRVDPHPGLRGTLLANSVQAVAHRARPV